VFIICVYPHHDIYLSKVAVQGVCLLLGMSLQKFGWHKLFPCHATSTCASWLEALDKEHENWVVKGHIPEHRLSDAVIYGQQLCICTEALWRQPRVCSTGVPFYFVLHLWDTPRGCDCIWAPVVSFAVHLLLLVLRNTEEWESKLKQHREPLLWRQQHHEQLMKVLGISEYVCERALPQWVDLNPDWIGLPEAPKLYMAHLHVAVNAYAHWNKAQWLWEQSKIHLSKARQQLLQRIPLPAPTPPAGADTALEIQNRDPQLMKKAADHLFRARVLLAQGVPPSLSLVWGTETKDSPTLEHTCQTPCVSSWTNREIKKRRQVVSTQKVSTMTWAQRLHTEWLLVLAACYEGKGAPTDALTLYRAAALSGWNSQSWLSKEQQQERIGMGIVASELSRYTQEMEKEVCEELHYILPLEWTNEQEIQELITKLLWFEV
jgi:hypothetical protein